MCHNRCRGPRSLSRLNEENLMCVFWKSLKCVTVRPDPPWPPFSTLLHACKQISKLKCVSNPNFYQSQEMTACVRGNANRCQIDYSIAGTDSDSPDTFEVGATTAKSETEACTVSALHINQCQVGTTEATVAAVGFIFPNLDLQLLYCCTKIKLTHCFQINCVMLYFRTHK